MNHARITNQKEAIEAGIETAILLGAGFAVILFPFAAILVMILSSC